MATEDRFATWAILELMGHRRLAGYVTEAEIAGASFLRLDVPEHEQARCTCDSSDPDSASHEDHRAGCWLFQPEGSPPSDVAATQFYAASAVYAITPTDEWTARRVAQFSKPRPVHQWELPAAAAGEGAAQEASEDIPF